MGLIGPEVPIVLVATLAGIIFARLFAKQPSRTEAARLIERADPELNDAILTAVGDQTVAQMVMLMGDGLYYNASAPDALASVGTPQYQAKVEDMVELVAALVRLRGEAGQGRSTPAQPV